MVDLKEKKRQRIVVVGLGMVAISLIEKLLTLDAEAKRYEIVVIGEESHLAYNRVGLTSFFDHRNVEELYLNPKEWYDSHPEALNHILSTRVTSINPGSKSITTSAGYDVDYDILVLATGSNAVVPENTPGHDSSGVFVYRNLDDLQQLITFSATVRGSVGCVVGGGLLGLEAAKAMMDLEQFDKVKLIDKNPWVLSRQLDQDAGRLVVEKVTELGLDVMSCKKIRTINVDEENKTKSVTFEDGDTMECTCICFAIGIKPRDELAASAGIKTAPRGGFIINKDVETNIPGIYAVGECASWDNQTFGLIAPGIEMADVLSHNLCIDPPEPASPTSSSSSISTPPDTPSEPPKRKSFRRPDLSTKLKLLGVNVASFGDFFADRDGPKSFPSPSASGHEVKALSYRDPFQAVYKKYLFTADGKFLLGGMIIGDTADYIKLVGMVKGGKELQVQPSQLILGAKAEGEENPDDLDDDTQICSCHNVTKGDISKVVKNGTCKSLGEVKSCTKAGTGCAGCIPLVQSIFNAEMKAMGAEVSNHLCPHFGYSRVDLFNIVRVKELKTFQDIIQHSGKDPTSLGCEVCKPACASILASLFNQHVMDKPVHMLQDTNDRFLANIQRNGTFSVIPRVPGGEITPDKLIAIGTVAKRFNLYCKITGGQRIDMFGARKQDLVEIWSALVDAGMESGHAYAKSLRTIKSCVGTTWCRFGVGDSVGMAIRLEERYKSIRAPHKIKSGVSGCIRECAEAQNKDFGLIATETGYNIFVGGNGGSKPRHSELLIKDCPLDQVIPVLDRYLMFYIRTADRLQRTARWLENLPGGIKYLKEVILDDKLGIVSELEKQMQELVGSYFCEWTQVVNDSERRKAFQQFANTTDSSETVELITQRSQTRPTYWPKDSVKYGFANHRWSSLAWQPIIEASHFASASHTNPVTAAIKRGDTQLAVYKVKGKYYATQQMCPHKRAFVLSDGLIGEDVDDGTPEGREKKKMWVSCPYHKRNFTLSGGGGEGTSAGGCSNDSELSIATFQVEERSDGWVYLKLPSVAELDGLLGTERWKVKASETQDPFTEMDRKIVGSGRGRRSVRPEERGANGDAVGVKTAGLEW